MIVTRDQSLSSSQNQSLSPQHICDDCVSELTSVQPLVITQDVIKLILKSDTNLDIGHGDKL